MGALQITVNENCFELDVNDRPPPFGACPFNRTIHFPSISLLPLLTPHASAPPPHAAAPPLFYAAHRATCSFMRAGSIRSSSPSFWYTSMRAPINPSINSSPWWGDAVMRRRSVPRGTVG